MKGKIDKALREALYKKAVGYVAEESVDELVADPYDGGMKLVKRKITKKQVPPDLSAAKLLYEITGDKSFDLTSMSDERLMEEKQRLESLREKAADVPSKAGRAKRRTGSPPGYRAEKSGCARSAPPLCSTICRAQWCLKARATK